MTAVATTEPPPARADRTALTACLVAAAALRLWNLGGADFWSDEVHTFDAVRLPIGEMVSERLRAGHPPLYFLLLKGWTEVFGTSQLALRLPSALLGVALLLPAFALFRRLLPAAGARWALVLTAVHPLLVELSREARMYPLLAVLFLVAAEGAFKAFDEGRVPARFWIAVALGPLVHPTWAFGILALAATVLRERKTARAAAVLVGIGLSVALLAAAVAASHVQHAELVRRPWPKEFLAFALRPHLGTASLGTGLLALAGGVSLWAIWCLLGLLEASARARRFALALVLGVPAASLLVGVLGGLAWGPARYLQAAAFGAILLAASGIGGMQAPPPGRVADHTGWLLVLYLAVVSILTVFGPGTPWSDAATRLRPEAGAVVVEEPGGRVVLTHYLGRAVEASPPADAAPYWSVTVDRYQRETVERVPPVTPR